MKTFTVLLICIGLVAASANSKIREKAKKRQIGGCTYKGQTYQQGQAWQDGCLYNCICENGATGSYKCTDRCPSYGDLPPVCSLVKQPGQCCSEPKCNFQASGGSSSGSGSGTIKVTDGTSGVCVDKLQNCQDYTKAVCSSHDYAQWVQDNCCAFCNGGTGGVIIGSGAGSTGGTGITTGTCQDAIPNCADYTAAVCTDSSYSTWAIKNCQRFCNKCSGTIGGPVIGGGTVTGGTGGSGTVTGTGVTGTGSGCTYKGQSYQQGQVWQDGCLYNCICENGATGSYKCTDRCPSYGDLPPVCSLEKQPGQCCSEPKCNFQATGGSVSGSGIGTNGTGSAIGTGTVTGGTGGVCVDKLQNCKVYTTAVCSNHDYAQWVQENCCAFCNGGTGGVISGSGTGGVISGSGTGGTVGTGGTGIISGSNGGTGGGSGTGVTTGTCQDAIPNCADYTAAVCTDSSYTTWVTKNCPRFCNKCSGTIFNGGSVVGGGTGGHGTVTATGNNTGSIPLPGTGHVIGTGTSTGSGTGSGSGTGTGSGCTYKGQTYQQGQAWHDGCLYNCICENGVTGSYKCTDRCPSYGDLPPVCALVKQPGQCCSEPQCNFQISGGSASGSGTLTGTGSVTGTGPVIGGTGGSCVDKLQNCKDYTTAVCSNHDYAKWVQDNCCAFCTGGTGGVITGTVTLAPGTGPITGGTEHTVGTCQDAIPNCADYTAAVCTDSSYTTWVTKNCPRFCNKCSGTGTITGGSGTGSGTATGGMVTVTGGGVYPPGGGNGGTGTTAGTVIGTNCVDTLPTCDTYDKSICSDAHYHDWVNQNCKLWCGHCSDTGSLPLPGTGHVIGTGTGTTGSGTGTSSGCTYKGQTYQQGQVWQDGCLYNCICENGATGSYKCTDRCPSYGDLPPVCALVKQPGQCCSEPKCNFQISGGSASGSGSGNGTITGTGTVTGTGAVTGGTGGVCVDKIQNCKVYTIAVCSNHDYAQWVQDNCCAFCNGGTGGLISGSGTGGVISGSGTGGTGGVISGSGTGGTGGVISGSGTGGTGGVISGSGTGGVISGSGTGGTGGTGIISGTCQDAIPNCADYTSVVCTDASYTTWVTKNCPRFCNKCHLGTGTIPLPGTGHVTGTGTCTDKISNCADYTQAVCTKSDYATWVLNNCAHYCNKCGSGSGSGSGGIVTGTGSGSGGGSGGVVTGTGSGSGGGSGGVVTGTGSGSGSGSGGVVTGTGTVCADVATNCAMLNTQAHICSDSGASVYAQQNCAKTCNLCGGSCHDAIANCNSYDPSVCTSADYKQWATQNCAATCHLCSSIASGGSMSSGFVTVSGGILMATESSVSSSGSGCVYNSHLYQQGETWKDGCKFSCQCVDSSTGKYQCSQLCVQWQLPAQCHLSPPAPGKCCQTPSCPAGFSIQYPQGYTEQ